jgi:hypothetical protein
VGYGSRECFNGVHEKEAPNTSIKDMNTSIKDMENLDAFKQEVARAPSSARLVNLKFRGGDFYINHIIHLSVRVA